MEDMVFNYLDGMSSSEGWPFAFKVAAFTAVGAEVRERLGRDMARVSLGNSGEAESWHTSPSPALKASCSSWQAQCGPRDTTW